MLTSLYTEIGKSVPTNARVYIEAKSEQWKLWTTFRA